MKHKKTLLLLGMVIVGFVIPITVSNVAADTYPVVVWDIEPPNFVGQTFELMFTAFSNVPNMTLQVTIQLDDLTTVYQDSREYFVNQEVTVSTAGLLSGNHTISLTCIDSAMQSKVLSKTITVDRDKPVFLTSRVFGYDTEPYSPGSGLIVPAGGDIQLEFTVSDVNYNHTRLFIGENDPIPGIFWQSSERHNHTFSQYQYRETEIITVKLVAYDDAWNTQEVHWYVTIDVEEVKLVPESELEEARKQYRENITAILGGVAVVLFLCIGVAAVLLPKGKEKRESVFA